LRHQGHANYADRGIAFVQIGTLSSRHISDFHLSLGDDYRVSHLNFLLGDTDGFAPAAADYPIKCPIDDLPSACRTAVFGTSILFEDELDLYLSTRASSGANGRTARQLTMATISRAMNRFQSAAVRAAASGAVVTQAAVGQPLTFSYTLSDTVPESAIASRQWTFGNNAPVSGANDATHAFSQAGSVNYSWSATLTDGNVITASGTLTVVGAAPPPSPTVDDVAPGSGTANTTVRMTVTGSNLPLTLVLTLEGANCARVSASSTLALFDCALGAAGPAPMSLWTDAYPNGTAIPSSFTGFLITAP
jgi:hypothetical protein